MSYSHAQSGAQWSRRAREILQAAPFLGNVFQFNRQWRYEAVLLSAYDSTSNVSIYFIFDLMKVFSSSQCMIIFFLLSCVVYSIASLGGCVYIQWNSWDVATIWWSTEVVSNCLHYYWECTLVHMRTPLQSCVYFSCLFDLCSQEQASSWAHTFGGSGGSVTFHCYHSCGVITFKHRHFVHYTLKHNYMIH